MTAADLHIALRGYESITSLTLPTDDVEAKLCELAEYAAEHQAT